MSQKPNKTFRFGDGITVGGYRIDEVASALQKSVRRGEERGALFWATELALTGYGNYAWKRLRIVASEDIGLGSPLMAVLVRTLYENWLDQKKNDGHERHATLFLVHAVLALCRAEKSRLVDHAYVVTMENRAGVEVPDYSLDKHTKAGRKMGRAMSHFYEEGAKVAPAADVYDPFMEEAVELDHAAERRKKRRPEEDGQQTLA